MTGEIIGRDAELSVVQAYLDRPVEGLRALVIEGEPGIGKSTLWLAGVAAARERSFRVLASRPAQAERSLPNVVLGDMFAGIEPELIAALPAPRRRALESALLLRDGPDIPVDPRALGVAIHTIMSALADGGPLVIAIDDDQWMDASSAGTLRFALRRPLGRSVLLLLARRTDIARAVTLEDVAEPTAVERLRVRALSVGAIQMLVRHRVGKPLPRPALLKLHDMSGGNPLYALELVRARRSDPAGDASTPIAVPASLEALVAERLEPLDARSRGALLLVAAHGRLPEGLVGTLGIARTLQPALAANLVETADGHVRFTHPLLASAVYQGAAGEERHEAHRRLASAIDDPVERGRHLALGADGPDGVLAATLESAAIVARDRGVSIAAAELADHALRLTPTAAADDRHRRAIATARAFLAAGDGSRARAIATDLIADAPAGRRRAEVLFLRSDLEVPGEAIVLLGEALHEASGEPALRATIHIRLADHGRLTNGRAWSERHILAALRLAEWLDDDALRAIALPSLALARFDGADPDALRLAERGYELTMRLADSPRMQAAAMSVLALVLVWSARPERARTWLEDRLAEWRDRDEQARAELVWYLAAVHVWSGQWDVAREFADQALEIGIGYDVELPQHHLPPALIALHRGDLAAAREHSTKALSLARGQLLPAHTAILGICAAWSGDPTAALARLDQAEDAADGRGWEEPNLRWWRAESVEVLLQLGHLEDAIRLVAGWEIAAERLGRERVLAQVVRCRGLIASAEGHLPVAIERLEEAADRLGAAGDPFGRGRALLALGAARRRARQKRAARAALEGALAVFEALGANGWAATARTELARIGGRARIEGLSPSERRVAELVAEGRTNREIAAALFLGERTVASHLTHIYSKLGVRSRTELAGQLLGGNESTAGDTANIPTF
jgi:DNA-binding CsgD family transcriptional regulator